MAVERPARSAWLARGMRASRDRSLTHEGRRNANTRPGMPWPGAKRCSRVSSAKRTISGGEPSARQIPAQRSSESASGRQTTPTLQPSVSPSVASTRSHSASGSSPAARWSAIACWANRR